MPTILISKHIAINLDKFSDITFHPKTEEVTGAYLMFFTDIKPDKPVLTLVGNRAEEVWDYICGYNNSIHVPHSEEIK